MGIEELSYEEYARFARPIEKIDKYDMILIVLVFSIILLAGYIVTSLINDAIYYV